MVLGPIRVGARSRDVLLLRDYPDRSVSPICQTSKCSCYCCDLNLEKHFHCFLILFDLHFLLFTFLENNATHCSGGHNFGELPMRSAYSIKTFWRGWPLSGASTVGSGSGAPGGWWRGSSLCGSKRTGQYFWLWPTSHTCWLVPLSSRYWSGRLRATTGTTSKWRSWTSCLITPAWTDRPWRSLFRLTFFAIL